ncbi:MAG: ABC transporter [Rhodospirillales bacterium]|nr:ABC transporter [Rhodospirillales bacterium]MSP80783.1 ABC transporter [Rhodospirillales bacterium]
MTQKPLGLAVLAAAGLFLAVNIAAAWGLHGWRVDFTADRLHTLSQGTRNTLAALTEPVTLKLFFSAKLSDQIPQFKAYGARVREVVLTYAARSGGQVKVEIIDPTPFSEAEDGAVQAGIQGVPIDNSSGRQFYFGLQGSGAGASREVIPFFTQERERFLEYDLTRMILNLNQTKKPLIAVIGDAPLEFGPGGVMAAMRGAGRPYMVLQLLRQTFDVKVLSGDAAEIDDEAAVLIVARPTSLTPKALYAVDQFVLNKGRALVFVDPAAESAAQGAPGGGQAVPRAEIPDLLAAWGVEMESGRFVADRRLGLPVETEDGAAGARGRVIPHPGWLGLGENHINRDDVVTAELSVINVGSIGSLKAREGSGLTFAPLLMSSEQAALMEVEKLGARPDPEGILRALKPTGQRYALAARITGRAKTAFPNGAPPDPAPETKDGDKKDDAAKASPEKKPEDAKPVKPHRAESAVDVNIIVVADSDLLEDRFWARVRDFLGQQVAVPFASNGDFVVNAVDNLAGSDDLIRLRSRGISYRPFMVVDDLRRDAADRFLARRDELQKALDETEKRLNELQDRKKQGAAAAATLSAEEESAIENFRDEMVRIRRQLREVQHGLERDIENLAAWLKAINIGLVPMGVLVVAGLNALARKHRRRIRVMRD